MANTTYSKTDINGVEQEYNVTIELNESSTIAATSKSPSMSPMAMVGTAAGLIVFLAIPAGMLTKIIAEERKKKLNKNNK